MIPPDIALINDWLIDTYGKDLLGRAKFRIVWSTDHIEKRFGTFDEYTPSGAIYLRTWTGVKELPKYPRNVWGECFILERVMDIPPDGVYGWDHYEPLWSFIREDRKTTYRPTWKSVNFLVQMILRGPQKTLQEHWNDQLQEWDDEAKLFYEIMEDDLPFKILQMKKGEGVTDFHQKVEIPNG